MLLFFFIKKVMKPHVWDHRKVVLNITEILRTYYRDGMNVGLSEHGNGGSGPAIYHHFTVMGTIFRFFRPWEFGSLEYLPLLDTE